MSRKTPRHNIFISFHEEDLDCKEQFVRLMGDYIVNKSVDTGNIDDTDLKTDRVRQIIREEYIKDATVTIVLIGPYTWRRKHVDWEIGASLRETRTNPRCGLLGILLPNHSDYGKQPNLHLIPPRLADNCTGADPYALLHNWPKPWSSDAVADWIHQAFVRRRGTDPDNSRTPFAKNSTRKHWQGWQS